MAVRRNAFPLPTRSDYEEQPLEHTSARIIAHKKGACVGDLRFKKTRPCPLHRRTNHSMRSFPQQWRDDRGIMERICPHGIGHPDPDQVLRTPYDGVHGCDGCCAPSQLDPEP